MLLLLLNQPTSGGISGELANTLASTALASQGALAIQGAYPGSAGGITAPNFRSYTYAQSAGVVFSSLTPPVATKPTGVVENDRLVAFYYGPSYITPTATLPSGWSLKAEHYDVSNTSYYYVATKTAGSSEPSDYTFSHSGHTADDRSSVYIVAVEGVDPATDTDVLLESIGTTNTITFPSINTTQDNDFVLLFGATIYSNSPSGTDFGNEGPSGTTFIAGDSNNTGFGHISGVSYFVQATAGATGDKTKAMADHFGSDYVAYTLAFKGIGSVATFDDVTVAANNNSAGAIGQATLTFGFTAGAAATIDIKAAANINVADTTLSSASALSIDGDLTKTLDVFTLSGVSDLDIRSSFSQSFADISLASVGTLPITGTLSIPVSSVTLTATSLLPIQANASVTFPATITSAGTLPIIGSASLSSPTSISSNSTLAIVAALSRGFDPVTISAIGSLPITANSSTSFATSLSSASVLAINAALSNAIASFSISSTGEGVVAGSGAANISIANFAPSITGQLIITGNANLASNTAVTSQGVLPIISNAALGFNISLASNGVLPIGGTLSKAIEPFTLNAISVLSVSGALSKTADGFGYSATGVLPIRADASIASVFGISSNGTLALNGGAFLSLNPVLLNGLANISIKGTSSTNFISDIVSVGILPLRGSLLSPIENITTQIESTLPVKANLYVNLDDTQIDAQMLVNFIRRQRRRRLFRT